MRRRSLILLGLLAGGLAAYSYTMLRHGPYDQAELTDNCSFPSYSNESYLDLIKEAKTLIAGYRDLKRQVRAGTIELLQLAERDYLSERFGEFMKQSKSPEETFVRFHAFGRALSGRRSSTDSPSLSLTCHTWTNTKEGSKIEKMEKPHALVIGSYQAPNGTFSQRAGIKISAFLLGRRYEELIATVRFRPDNDLPTISILKGDAIVDPQIGTRVKAWPLSSIKWGDARIQNTCPVYERFIAAAEAWKKSKIEECR